jgi:hypothetical protein
MPLPILRVEISVLNDDADESYKPIHLELALGAGSTLNTLSESLLTAARIIFAPFDNRIRDRSFTSPFKIKPLSTGGTDVNFLFKLPLRKQP